ncbi:MAG: hypothetical protein CFE23_12510 [Flavobacterium sp. BFFFF1]|uniref:YDG domain-containing protein n=1 Tax=Flavobacterium sp. BFFFF1 TaxID=2015557 RepID=UPI000BD8689D|nr:YDG domain-containing protein [Flavobacterium sp. BFFFF1]OYU79721.1 MAG: hypothetical protein CFE23_12510 [Flavobacterium sp. BFFFF1]
MKSTLLFKKNFSVSLFCLTLFCLQWQVKAQVIITNTTPVTQNFNSMGTSGTASLPTGFKIGTDYTSGTTATTQAYGTSGTGAVGASSSGAAVNWADGVTGSSTDRAVGFLNSGSFSSPRSIIMEIQNNGASNITSLLVSFNYEKYRSGSRAFDWTFFHGATTAPATANTAGDQSYAADGGNTVVNPATSVSKSFTLSGLSIAPAAKYYLRWTFTGVGGSSNGQGIGIDNVSLTATFPGATPSAVFTTTYGTASAVQTFTVSGSNLTTNLTATAPAGFEVSADGISYNTTASFTQSGGNASGSLRIRLKANAAVGSYNAAAIVLSSTGATSVNVATPASGNVVNAKSLTITGLTGTNKVYDRNVTASFTGTATYSGLVNGESFVVSGTPTATFTNFLAGNGKTIAVSGYTAPSANYTITQPSLTANITPKAVSISGVTVNNKSYDNSNTAVLNLGSATVIGVISPDVVAVDAALATALFDTTDAGTSIGVTISGLGISGADAANYTLSAQPTGITANINKADQVLTFSPLDLKLDTDPDFGLTATASSGLTVSYTSSDTNVATISGNTVDIISSGTTTITALQAGNNNYNPAVPVDQVLNVSSTAKQDQVITFNALAPVTYGDAAFELLATATSGLPITYSSSDTNVATVSGNTVTIIAPGTTTIIALQIGDANFNPATPVQQSLNITVKTLTVTGTSAASKEYNGNTIATLTGATLVGIVGSDEVTVSGNGSFVDANAGSSKAITAMLALSGADSTRYSITQPIGLSADITPKAATISGISVNDKIYDANTAATLGGIAAIDGILPADMAEVLLDATSVTADFETPTPGNGKNVTVTGYTLTGASAPNYVLSQPVLTGNLLPKALLLSGIVAESKTYDGTTNATFSGTPAIDGIIGTEDVIIDGTATVAFTDANAGANKILQINGLSLTGADAGNYTLDSSGITASILPATLTYIANPAVRQYNTANPGFTGSVNGFVNGENITATTGTLIFTSPANASSTPGIYAINGAGLTATNYSFTQDAGNTTALTIIKADQTITFGTLPVKTTADAPFALTATASSGLAVSFSSANPAVATVSGATVTITGTGTSTITASQAGNTNYNAAVAVDRTLTVNAVPVSIFSNPITGTNPNTSNPYTTGQTLNANITVSGIGRSTGITGTNANDRYTANGWNTPAIDTAKYFELTITPNSGYEIDFANFIYTGQASGTGPTSVVIRSSKDNYVTGIGSPTVAGTTISLSATAYQDITTAITFRIYAFGASASAGTFSINSFTFNGNVNASAVPSISVTPAALTALDYFVGSGPSASKTLSVTGANLNPVSGSVTATASVNFEVSADNITFANEATIPYTNGGITNALVYVRSVSGLVMGTYNGTVAISGGGAPTVNRNVQAIVREPFRIPYTNDFRTQVAVDNALAQGFVINNATFNATGYEQIGLNGYIETPVIDFTQTRTIQVGYAAATFGGVSGQTLELQISVDGGTNYTTIGTLVPPSASFTTTKTDVDLTLYPVTTGKLRIKMTAGSNTTRFRDLYILKTTTWDGDAWSNGTPDANAIAAIAGDYTTQVDGALIAKSLTVLSGTVTVSSGTTMRLEDELNNAGTVLFENNANLIQVSAASNTGEITVKRNAMMRRQDYVYWSSPVSNQLLFDFTPETLPNRFYVLNETTNLFTAVDPTATTFANGKGYMLRAPNDFPAAPQNFVGVFQGAPHNGTVVVPVTTAGLGYNLIGNPYPSPISAAAFALANPTIGTLYFWTHTQQGADSGANYATYNETGAASALGGEVPNGTIQNGQGFMVKVPLNTTTVTFSNSMRADNHDNQFFRSADNPNSGSRLWLNLTSAAKKYNQILIGYVEGATDGLDIQFDGKMLENQNAVLYNILDNTSYTIQGKALPFADSDSVPLGFKASEAGNYTITLDHFDGLFSEGQDIFLKDHAVGTTVNLKDAPYTFATVPGTFEQRFEVVYQNSPLAVTPVTSVESMVIFTKDNHLEIHTGNINLSDVALFDIRGRLLFEQSGIDAPTAVVRNPGISEQLIIVRATLADGRVVSRKIVF